MSVNGSVTALNLGQMESSLVDIALKFTRTGYAPVSFSDKFSLAQATGAPSALDLSEKICARSVSNRITPLLHFENSVSSRRLSSEA